MDSSTIEPSTVLEAVPTPLVVDLDGTLLRTDLLHETVVQLCLASPLEIFRLPVWLGTGKATLKRQVAQRTSIHPATLPYNADVVQWLKEEHHRGRRIYLCTASHVSFARQVAAHFGFFEDVMATDGLTNLAAERKADALVARFGAGGFDYAGNSAADLAVWRHARHAIVVDAPPAVLREAQAMGRVDRVFGLRPSQQILTWIKLARVHQWLKNLLLFVPLLAAHQIGNVHAWINLLLAFAAFSLCASSVYIANDLMDIESDRQHPRKRDRAFAAGMVPIRAGVLAVPILALASIVLALLVHGPFLAWLGFYLAITWAYSWWLKRVVLVDCLCLAGLYTIRILAGAAAVDLHLSFWLIAFSGFIFLSLAFVKRSAELQVQAAAGSSLAHGRAYFTADAPLIQVLGIVSGYTSVVVLALYLNSDAILRLYQAPQLVWAAVPVMVWWVSWIWLRTFRGEMHDDPLVFAFRDRGSLIAGGLFGVILAFGARGLPW